METIRCLILGSGPAGYTAAIYAARAGLSPVLYEGLQPGGQLTTTTEVENFPGYPEGVDGNQMMDDMRAQAQRFGAEMRSAIAVKADLSAAPYAVTFDDGSEVRCHTLVIATGATAKYLGLPDEEKYRGQGVSACATCDGFFYRKKNVAVVGGGDTACEEATYLAGLAAKVYLIVRKPFLRASKAMQQKVMENPKIEILFETNTVGLFGTDGVEGAHLVRRKGEPDETPFDIAIDGFFLAIGHHPNSELFTPWVKTDEAGRHTAHRRARCVCRGRRGRPSLPPGHHRRRLGLQGSHRGRTLPHGPRPMNRPFRRSARRRSWSRLLPALALLLLLTSCSSTRRIADIDFAQLVRASQRLGFDIEYKDDHPLYVESASWIGTPYRYGGNDRHGVDCSGLSRHIYRVCYRTDIPRQSQQQYDDCDRHVRKRRLRPGDLVFFRQEGTRRIRRKVNHVGIYMKDGLFLHASSSRGVMVSRLDNPYWRKLWLRGGRYRK